MDSNSKMDDLSVVDELDLQVISNTLDLALLTNISLKRNRGAAGDRDVNHANWPKMAFPQFDCSNPCIWCDKCNDYFCLFNGLCTHGCHLCLNG